MEKNKLVVVLILVIFLILGCGFLIYNQNHFKVNATYFKVPEGFHTIDNEEYVNLTDGKTSLAFVKNNSDKSVNESLVKYANSKKNEYNASISVKNFTIDNIIVYKSNVKNNTQYVHYWYEDSGEVYELFSWSGNQDIDFIVSDLIKYRQKFGI